LTTTVKNNRGILVASLLHGVDDDQIMTEVNYIIENLNLSNKYLFLFRYQEDPLQYLLTYNIITKPSGGSKSLHPYLFTLRVHRKKQTNTLYTINGLNAAVAAEHNGKTGKDLRLEWDKYKNMILLTRGKKLQAHPLEVVRIYQLEDEPEEN
jgi:hypothetical protein